MSGIKMKQIDLKGKKTWAKNGAFLPHCINFLEVFEYAPYTVVSYFCSEIFYFNLSELTKPISHCYLPLTLPIWWILISLGSFLQVNLSGHRLDLRKASKPTRNPKQGRRKKRVEATKATITPLVE